MALKKPGTSTLHNTKALLSSPEAWKKENWKTPGTGTLNQKESS